MHSLSSECKWQAYTVKHKKHFEKSISFTDSRLIKHLKLCWGNIPVNNHLSEITAILNVTVGV